MNIGSEMLNALVTNRMPLYFFHGAQPYTTLFEVAQAVGVNWADLCNAVELPDIDDHGPFFEWLVGYLREQARAH